MQTHSAKTYDRIYKYCTQFGSINKTFHFRTRTKLDEHNILLEYNANDSARNILKSMKTDKGKLIQFKHIELKKDWISSEEAPELQAIDGCNILADDEICQLLKKQQTIDHQINVLYSKTCINELNTRLRFLVAAELTEIAQNLWSDLHVQAFPFGSSVNGFGRMDSDLDVILYAQPDKFTYNREFSQQLSGNRTEIIARGYLNELANYMRQYENNFSRLEPILGARVPIIKYYDNYLKLDVDLSMSAVLVQNHFYHRIYCLYIKLKCKLKRSIFPDQEFICRSCFISLVKLIAVHAHWYFVFEIGLSMQKSFNHIQRNRYRISV